MHKSDKMNEIDKEQSNIITAGASVIGQAHIESGLPNQDYYIIKKYSSGMILAVADGLGSRKHSDIGSRAVCQAVCSAFESFSKKSGITRDENDMNKDWIDEKDRDDIEVHEIDIEEDEIDIPELLNRIHTNWINNQSISGDILQYATTCLFAIYLYKGCLILGQLGDGLVCYKSSDGFFILSESEEEFTNLTSSISSESASENWQYESVNLVNKDFILMLATDGVSEDLIKEKREGFLSYLRNIIRNEESTEDRSREVKNILKGWITKYHNDDKTLLVLDREG